MGNSVSHEESHEVNHSKTLTKITNFYFDKYNLIPSLPGHEYTTINMDVLKKKYNVDDKIEDYIDLRNTFPNIINMDILPFNPVISVVYILHWALLRNKLPIFPPSPMYIYRNISYYKNVKSLLCFDVIFNSIKEFGFCSENEFHMITENLTSDIPLRIKEKSLAFKFIKIYKVEQELYTIQHLLKNKYPILIGLTIYYDLTKISSYMWMPDATQDKKLGGLGGVLVGYINERKMFIMASTFGGSFGTSGFILIPYEYVLNPEYTFELYTLDFDSDRVDGYINQRKQMISLENKNITQQSKQEYNKDMFGNLFG